MFGERLSSITVAANPIDVAEFITCALTTFDEATEHLSAGNGKHRWLGAHKLPENSISWYRARAVFLASRLTFQQRCCHQSPFGKADG